MLDDKGVIGGSDRQCRFVAVVGCRDNSPRVRELREVLANSGDMSGTA